MFEEPSCCFPVPPVYRLASGVRGFSFLHILTNMCYSLVVLTVAILPSVRWCVIVVLICVSLVSAVWAPFHVPSLAVYMSSLENVQILTHFFDWIPWLFAIDFVSSLYIVNINPLSDIWLAVFFLFGRLPFHFVDGFLHCREAFNLFLMGILDKISFEVPVL